MPAEIGFIILECILLYVISVNLRKYTFNLKEAVLIIVPLVLLGIAAAFVIPAFVPASILVNMAFAIVLTAVIYINVKQTEESVFYAVFTVVLSLSAVNITSVLIGFILVRGDSFTADVITSGTAFLIAFTASRKLGSYIRMITSVHDDEHKKRLFTYLMYGAGVTLGAFLISAFLWRGADGTGYTASLVAGLSYLIFTTVTFADNTRMERELSHKDELMSNMKAYAEHVERTSAELRQFRHDHLNLMLGFKAYADNRDWEGFEQYYGGYMKEFTASTNEMDAFAVKIDKMQMPVLKGIILDKCMKAQQTGIGIRVEVRDSVVVENSDAALNLCRIVGILMDNAVEACQGTDGAGIQVLVTSDGSGLLFVVENTCAEPPPIHFLFNKGFTTKGAGRGLGLYKVSRILSQNKMISLDTAITDGVFCQKIRITNPTGEL